MIKEKNGWWYLVGIGCFYGYPFPTRAALKGGKDE